MKALKSHGKANNKLHFKLPLEKRSVIRYKILL